MGQDISALIAGNIVSAKTFGSSENIRHGKNYKFEIQDVFAERIEGERAKDMAFVILKVLHSEPNPQTEGDLVNVDGQLKLKDNGLNPNPAGALCAMKVNFSGDAAVMAGANVKNFMLGLFGYKKEDVTEQDLFSTWIDITRRRDLKPGELDMALRDEANPMGKPSPKFKAANPMCGALVAIPNTTTREKKKTRLIKELPREKREYVTVLNWGCVSRPGSGENTLELIAERRKAIESAAPHSDDDEDGIDDTVSPPVAPPPPSNGQSAAPPPPAPPTPPAEPSDADFKKLGWFTNGMQAGNYHNGKEVLPKAALRQRLGI